LAVECLFPVAISTEWGEDEILSKNCKGTYGVLAMAFKSVERLKIELA